jgi:glucose/mannose-6-phosphate isomerase
MMSIKGERMSEFSTFDSPSEIQRIDKSNMLQACEKTPSYCRDAIQLAEKIRLPNKIKASREFIINYEKPSNIVVAGMGGSAIGGELLKDWLRDRAQIPIEVSREYTLPAYVDDRSLVIAVSYSGETEETLGAFVDAIRRRSMVVAISSGGHLQKFSQDLKIPHMKIPDGFPAPRAAISYTFFPLLVLMEKLHVIDHIDLEIKETLSILQKISDENALNIPTQKNKAKRLALEIGNTIPLVCGFGQYNSVARRLKCQFNENSKIPSRFEAFSELNHNEIVGWEGPETMTGNLSAILLRDPDEPPEITRRIEITRKIASEKFNKILEIQAIGQERLPRMMSAMHLGDFVSIYLALAKNIDPTPTRNIDYLKQELKKDVNKISIYQKEIKSIINSPSL